jgi:hypothetical protein
MSKPSINHVPFLSSEQSPLYRKYSESSELPKNCNNSCYTSPSDKYIDSSEIPDSSKLSRDSSYFNLEKEYVPDGLRLNEFLVPVKNNDGETVFIYFIYFYTIKEIYIR